MLGNYIKTHQGVSALSLTPLPHPICFQIMFSACELGVFDLLLESEGPLSSDAIAERLGTSASGMERLLDACVGLKLLGVEMKSEGGNVVGKGEG